MSELLQAAKAVIDEWDYYGTVYWEKIKTLRAAVERAEKQEAIRLSDDEIFDIENNLPDEYIGDIKYTLGFARAIEQVTWTAAQQAERERVKNIIRYYEGGDVGYTSKILDAILEKIDVT